MSTGRGATLATSRRACRTLPSCQAAAKNRVSLDWPVDGAVSSVASGADPSGSFPASHAARPARVWPRSRLDFWRISFSAVMAASLPSAAGAPSPGLTSGA